MIAFFIVEQYGDIFRFDVQLNHVSWKQSVSWIFIYVLEENINNKSKLFNNTHLYWSKYSSINVSVVEQF